MASSIQQFLGPAPPEIDPDLFWEAVVDASRDYQLYGSNCDRYTDKLLSRALKKAGRRPAPPVVKLIRRFIDETMRLEKLYGPTIPYPSDEHIPLCAYLYHRVFNKNAHEKISDSVMAFAALLMQHLPEAAYIDSTTPTTASLLDYQPELPTDMGHYISTILDYHLDDGFPVLGFTAGKLTQNVTTASEGARGIIVPHESSLKGDELITAYFKDTPFLEWFMQRLPFSIPEHIRAEHAHVIGGSGAGKTTLLQQTILDDLASENPPAMVIVDPKGQMTDRLSRLDIFNPDTGRLRDRLIIIDPCDDEPPALNMFDPMSRRFTTYSQAVRSRIQAQTISMFDYIFNSTKTPLTSKMRVPFAFCARLLFATPNATIVDFLDLLDDPAKTLSDSKFAPFVGRLDPISQRFFRNDYYGSTEYAETKRQIKGRLNGLLARPEFLTMFSAPVRKIDMFECIQARKIVLINTQRNLVGAEASQLLGRYFIAMTLNAAFERITLKDKKHWHFAHLVIDEFQDFVDEDKTPELLRLAREYNLGVTIAHQNMNCAELNDNLRAAISTNTSTKYAAAVEGVDRSYVARDLRCDPEFLTSHKRTHTHVSFACFVRHLMDKPITISAPIRNVESQPQMSEQQHAAMLDANRQLVSAAELAPTATPEVTIAKASAPPPQAPHDGTPEAGPSW